MARARLLAELGDDIGFDDDTVETVVSLVDQVHTLRGQLGLLARAIAEQPAETREAIAVALQKLDAGSQPVILGPRHSVALMIMRSSARSRCAQAPQR